MSEQPPPLPPSRSLPLAQRTQPGFCCNTGRCSETYDAQLKVYFNQFDYTNSCETAVWCEPEETYKSKILSLFFDQVMDISLNFLSEPASLAWVEILSTRESDTLFDSEWGWVARY